MKLNLLKLMYEDPAFGEIGFKPYGAPNVQLAPGDQFPKNARNVPPQFQASVNGQYVSASRIGIAFDRSPNFTCQGFDINGCAYGTLYIAGDDTKWRCDGKTVYTTINADDDEDSFTAQELYRTALFPVVLWYCNQHDDIKDFPNKYRNALTKISADECLYVSNHFHYGHATIEGGVEVLMNCNDALCMPATDKDIIVNSTSSTPTQNNAQLPWHRHPDIPNDLSIVSAIAGKYNLRGEWGMVNENGKSYDFTQDMINPADMEDYVDNPDFHAALQQVIGYIGSLFRTNKLVWDGNTPINKLLEQNQVQMRRSNQQNMMLAGEPGAGKTLMCRMIAAALGIPCVIIRLGERSEKDELTQEVIATDHGFDTIKSKLYWYARYGGLVVFDDLSNADPNMFFSVVGGLLESPYEYLVNQETIKRHPLCLMMATTNVGTTGSQPMNEALLTRFGSHYVVERLSDDAFKRCITTRAQGNSGIVLKEKTQTIITNWTFNVFQSVSKAVRTVDRETADRLITMRAAIGTAEKILNAIADGFEVDCKKAASQTMANILYTGGNPTLQKAVADAIESAPSITI